MQKRVKKKIIYVGFSFNQHGNHSGYDYIKNVVPYDIIINCQKGFDFQQRLAKKGGIFAYFYFKLFGSRLWGAEVRCLFYTLFNKNLIFHFIYAEKTYRYLGYLKGKSNEIVCTFHQPPDFFESNPVSLKGAKFIDKIIVMSSNMVEPMQKYFAKSKFYFIPHGVDTTYFMPNFKTKGKRVLMVGDWLRNFEFANTVFQEVLSINNFIEICVVSNKDNHKFFNKHDRLFLLTNMSDDSLLDLYQTSAILFLPLIKFTANNALLEGGACGCSIMIATDQQMDKCYIDRKFIDILPQDTQLVTDKIIELLNKNSISENSDLMEYIKERYDWRLIGKFTKETLLE